MIAILRHFLLRMIRDRGLPAQTAGFFALALLVCIFAIGNEQVLIAATLPGLAWAILLLSSLLGLPSLLEIDELDDLMLAHAPLPLLLALKMAAHFLSTCLPIILFSPFALALMMPEAMLPLPVLWMGFGLGGLSFSAIGLLGAALTLETRRNAALQALIVMPLCIPALIFGAGTITSAQLDLGWQAPLAMTGAFACASATLAPFAAAAILRMKVSTC